MADEDTERGSSFLNANTLFALLTVCGGIWFVSQKLTSNRPVVPAGQPHSAYIGEQQIDARLWEDPFKKTEEHTSSESPNSKDNTDNRPKLAHLLEQIGERTTSDPVLILPVMVDGGNFGEDKESRLRARFAVVSGLGRSGWVPEDPQHLGAITVPWSTQRQLDEAVKNTNLFTAERTNFWTECETLALAEPPKSELFVPFEWYRPRTFAPPTTIGGQVVSKILLLWLDESFFDDEPLIRISMLIEPLLALPDGKARPRVALIGPRGSNTLRLMLPTERTKAVDWAKKNPNLFKLVRSTLANIDLYSATPSVMDEALISDPDPNPRRAVGSNLVNIVGFKSFQNFAVTTSQLARDLYSELALRNVDLATNRNHVALISEWDTYYGRTLSIAYQSALYARQTNSPPNAIEYFIHAREKGTNLVPTNFHSFVYLRGLDGQTVNTEKSDDNGGGSRKRGPDSFEELRHWEPESNEMYGPAQFDYLTRLGDQLEELEKRLRRTGEGRLRAVGIVGSDVYDTLLILQALRRRFDGALFFTTDLDARLYSPRERDWARNLIVVSAYGIALHPHLQQDIAPFRDSTQTALFTATLAALGNNSLTNLHLRPRIFEIGNRQAVNFSQNETTFTTVHPETLSHAHLQRGDRHDSRVGSLCIVVGALVLALSFVWKPLRNLTVGVIHFDRPLGEKARQLRRFRALIFWIFAIAVALAAWRFSTTIWEETYFNSDGEMFSLTNGTSAWPALILRFIVIVMGIWFCIDLYFHKRAIYFSLTDQFRFSTKALPREAHWPELGAGEGDPETPVEVESLWRKYGAGRHWFWQLFLVGLFVVAYFYVSRAIFHLSTARGLSPVRGKIAEGWNHWLLWLSMFSFMALTFSTIDAVTRCSYFVSRIGSAPSKYPSAVLKYFSKKRGNISEDLLDEWIDVRLIAALTERVGCFVYYPCWLMLLLWLSRSSWFDDWDWSPPLIILYVSNFVLALASVLILQRAAKDAQRKAIDTLTDKVKDRQAKLKAKEPGRMEADESAELLQEIRDMKKGAFVPVWQSPAIGAFFLSSGGLTLVQILSWVAGR
jgi:hypothetical protein